MYVCVDGHVDKMYSFFYIDLCKDMLKYYS